MSNRKYDKDLAILEGDWGACKGGNLLWQYLEEAHDEAPDNTATICTHQASDHLKTLAGEGSPYDCLAWSYRQMKKATTSLASALLARGVKEGDTLVAFLPGCVEWALCYWIATLLELTFVPLNPATLSSCCNGEDYPLGKFGTKMGSPDVVLVPNLKDAWEFDALYADLSKDVTLKIVCFENEGFVADSWDSLSNLAVRSQGSQPFPKCHPMGEERVAAILFSSGTSGSPPKGCKLTVSNIKSTLVNQYSSVLSERCLVTTSPSGVATLETAVGTWKRGETLVMPGVYTPDSALDMIERHGCTRLICTSIHLQALIEQPSTPQRLLCSLRSLAVTGDVANRSVLEKTQKVLGVPWITSLLSKTEALGVIGWHRVLQQNYVSDSVGTVLCGSKVKICDDQNRILKRGEQGNLHVSGNGVIPDYLGGISAWSFYQDEDGERWLITGDVAMIDKDRAIYIVGRKKDMIGQDAPTSVERKHGQDEEDEMVVVQVNNKLFGKATVAIVRSQRLTASGMMTLSLEQLGRVGWPINEAGKIQRSKLREDVVRFLNNTWSC